MKTNSYHYAVMDEEVKDLFFKYQAELFIDCTLGMGGHARKILEQDKNVSVIACDCDLESLRIAKEKLKDFKENILFFYTNYTDIFEKADLFHKEKGVVLVDQGLSMYQIKGERRGFSHSIDSDLDMRKDLKQKLGAKEVINQFSYKDLKEIFLKYGEIKQVDELVQRIVETRLVSNINSSTQLTKIVSNVFRWKPIKGKLHPAAQVFQALRIYVNEELEDLESFLINVPHLRKGMIVILLTYHSIEDRIVKQKLKDYEMDGRVRIIKPFPMRPRKKELIRNPASRSAKLRAVQVL